MKNIKLTTRLDKIDGMTRLKKIFKLKIEKKWNLNDWFDNMLKLEDVIWSLNLNKCVT